MKTLFAFLFAALIITPALAQSGYSVGDQARGFTLKSVDNSMVSLSDYTGKNGVIVIFTCNHCPYAKAYEQRIIDIDKKYKPLGYPVVAINPNDPDRVPEDSYASMQNRSKEKGYPFPYLLDETQEIAKAYGAVKTPHVYLITPQNGKWIVQYIGAIDDSPMDANSVHEKYLEDAIHALINGEKPDPNKTMTVGCTIKWKM